MPFQYAAVPQRAAPSIYSPYPGYSADAPPPKAPGFSLGDIISAIGYGGQPDLGAMPGANGGTSMEGQPSVAPRNTMVEDFLKALGKQDQGSEQIIGASNLPGEIAAPTFAAPDYSAAETALRAAQPHPISAPQYVKPNYEASDKLWDQAAPAPLDQQAMDEDKWGRIISGAAGGILNAGHQKLLAGIIGGLGGYGTALQNRTKMTADQAEKQSEYLARKAGYTAGRINDTTRVENSQLGANYDAERTNMTEANSFARALGGLEQDKATGKASAANQTAAGKYQADVRNAEIQANKKGFKIIDQKDGRVIYQYIDQNGNVVAGTKPLAGFHGVNGATGGKLGNAAADGSVSGMEQLINMAKATGAMRSVVGDDKIYADLIKPEMDYGSGTMGDLAGQYGEEGKKMALQRAQAEVNMRFYTYLQKNPDKLEALVMSLKGAQ